MAAIRSAAAAAAFLAAAAAVQPACAQKDDVVLALPALNLGFAPTYVAEGLGLWDKAGLNVKHVVITGIGAMNAVFSKSADFSNSSGATIIRAHIRGQKVLTIANTFTGIPHELVITKSLAEAAGVTDSAPIAKRAAAIKGKKIAVGSPNTIPHAYLRYFSRKGGIDPERDITIAAMQPEASLAALKTGAIDGFVQSQPYTGTAIHNGTGVLLSSGLRKGGDFPEVVPLAFNGIVTRPDVCDQRPTVCARLVAGYEQAMGYMQDHPRESLEILAKRLPGTDPAVLAESVEQIRMWTPRSGRMDEAFWHKAQEIMLVGGMLKPEEKLASFADIYTNKFVK